MALTFERIKTHMEIFEGRASHMYLDAVGKVYAGIANMLPDVASAQALGFEDRETGEQATPPQIAAEFDAMLKQPKGLLPYAYKPHAKLYLPEPEIDALLSGRLEAAESELRGVYPNYDAFPDSAKLAVLDMAFGLGSDALRTHWPRLNAAIGIGDWRAAALECARPEAVPLRNENTKALFEIAGTDKRS